VKLHPFSEDLADLIVKAVHDHLIEHPHMTWMDPIRTALYLAEAILEAEAADGEL
jgi:hypothetical protein